MPELSVQQLKQKNRDENKPPFWPDATIDPKKLSGSRLGRRRTGTGLLCTEVWQNRARRHPYWWQSRTFPPLLLCCTEMIVCTYTITGCSTPEVSGEQVRGLPAGQIARKILGARGSQVRESRFSIARCSQQLSARVSTA
jgi:hypothetical protein